MQMYTLTLNVSHNNSKILKEIILLKEKKLIFYNREFVKNKNA